MMNLLKALKDLIFGPTLKDQFVDLLEKEEAKEEVEQPVVKKKTTRTKKKK